MLFLPSLPRLRRRFRACFVVIGLVLALVLPGVLSPGGETPLAPRAAIAQYVPPFGEGSPAYLWLWFDPEGTATLSFTLDTTTSTEPAFAAPIPAVAMEQALTAVLGCELQDSWVDSVDTWFELWGTCPLLGNQGVWQSQINLAPLLDQLNALQVDEMEFYLSHPDLGIAEVEPVLAPNLDYLAWEDRQNELAYGAVINVSAPEFTTVQLTFGYPPIQWAAFLALPIGALLLPLGLMLVMRQRALRNCPDDPAPVWFGYQRTLNWLVIGVWVLWATVIFSGGIGITFDRFISDNAAIPKVLLSSLAFTTPPALVIVGCYALSHAVFQRVGQMEWSLGDLVQQAVWSQVRTFLPLILAVSGVITILDHRPQLGVALIAIAYVIYLVATQALLKAADMTMQAVTVGDLRDRIFALAKPAGVTLKQVYILPMKRGRMANAFAVSGGNVLLTDYLLQHLDRQEVDAIMAHELAHLQYKHPQKLQQIFLVALVITIIVAQTLQSWVSWFPAIPLSVILTLLVFYGYSRRFEHEADIQAVLLTGNPAAMITGLVKLARLNLMPLQWGKVNESMLTHPSIRRRVEAIAQRYDLSPEQVEHLFQETEQPSDRYTVPISDEHPEPVFSSTAKQATILWLSWWVIAAATLPSALVARLVMGQSSMGQSIGYTVGVVLTIAVILLIANFGSVWSYRRFDKLLRQRLQAQGIEIEGWGGQFVGLAPGDRPCLYEGFADWDVGFLFSFGDRLCYAGEQTRFALRWDQITEIQMGEGIPGWWRSPRICIFWNDPDSNSLRSINLRAGDARSLRQIAPLNRQLHGQLTHWQTTPPDRPVPEALADLTAPAIGAVTRTELTQVLTAQQLQSLAFLIILVAIGLGLLLGLPPRDIAYVAIAALIGECAYLFPWMRQPRSTPTTQLRES